MWGRLHELSRESETIGGLSALRQEIEGRLRLAVSETESVIRDLFTPGRAGEQTLRISALNARLPSDPPVDRPGTLVFDEPLRVMSGLRYDFRGIAILDEPGSRTAPAFLVEAENVENVALESFNARLASPTGFLRLRGCRRVVIADCDVSDAFYGIVLRDGNREVVIRDNHLHDTTRAPILLQGGNEWVEIDRNVVVGTNASSNWAAGIVLSAAMIRDPINLAADFWPDYHWPIPDKVRNRLRCPKHILCTRNRVERSRASGVFCDGTLLCVIADNTIDHCDKEGLCLDIGSCLTLVEGNRISGNGRRACQSDEDLKHDFVLWGGREADGSAVCKLPGVSMDNSLLNIVRGNFVRDNAGGGVKMVRTCFLNWVDGNIIEGNSSPGATEWIFPGVLVEGSDPDADTDEHDFLPSYGNVVSANVIQRHDPAPGIIVRDNCSDNVLWGNSITSSGLGIDARYARRIRCQRNAAPGGIMVYRPLYSPIRKVAGRTRKRLRRWMGGEGGQG